MKILCIQGSLNKSSKTDVLLRAAFDKLQGVKKSYLDLREINLQFCDGREHSAYNEDLQIAAREIDESDAYIIGMPVYCYSVSGVLKNFLDITCGKMENKPFAIVCAAGGEHSYLATAELQKSLAFEVRARAFPRVVYASGKDFSSGAISSEAVSRRIDQLAVEFAAWAQSQSIRS